MIDAHVLRLDGGRSMESDRHDGVELNYARRVNQNSRQRTVASDCSWPAMTHPVVCCTARQFDRQVYGIEIELV